MFGFRPPPLPIGHIDRFSHGVLYGWAWTPCDPYQRLNIDVFHDGCFLGQFEAGLFRQDLLANAIGDGRHAFRAHIPGRIPESESHRFEAYTSFPTRVALSHPVHKPGLARDALPPRSAPAERVRHMFSALLKQLAATKREGIDQGPSELHSQPRLYEALVGPSPIRGAPALHGHTLSAYTDQIRHMYDLADTYDPSFSTLEYDAFLKWYLEHYSATRGPKRVPLSSAEIEYLNTIIDSTSSNTTTTRAASFFIEDYLGRSAPRSLSDDELSYWWSAEKSRTLFVEDCLVPDNHVRLLQQVRNDVGDYPLSVFMETFIAKNVLFKDLATSRSDQRRMIYFIVMLYALRMPHILAFLPRHWLDFLLAAAPGEASPFEQLVTSVFGRPGLLTAQAYKDHLGGLAFDVDTKMFRFAANDGSRIFAASLPTPNGAPVDIQIIGPFDRTLGLSQSCRLLAELIGTVGYTVNLVEFDLGNHSPIQGFNAYGSNRFLPARINILHLNAEAIPAAIAYSPDVFTNAYNIAFCYWELDSPADCQLLGLTLIDEVWTASIFVANVFRPYCKSVTAIGLPCETGVVGDHGTNEEIRAKYGIADNDFVFLNVSDALSHVSRKNPIGAIRAFAAAFPDNGNVRLIIKTHNMQHVTDSDQQRRWAAIRDVVARDNRIILINDTFSYQRHRMLIEASDCLVSLHRAEGFGLDLLYAVSRGVPVIATAYSGNMDFCNSDTVWLIDFQESYVGSSEYAFVRPGHKWVSPDHDAAVAAMREIVADPVKREMLAHNGRRFVGEHFSPEVVSARLNHRLMEIFASKALMRRLR